MISETTERPVAGKTYSLFGAGESSEGYFRAVAGLADEALDRCPDAVALLRSVRALTRRWPGWSRARDPIRPFLAVRLEAVLSPFLGDVAAHRRSLPLHSRFGSALATRRDAYLALMLEVELTNRIGAPAFRRCSRKLAFLPHCLRDLASRCRAGPEGLDWVCRGCSKTCGVRLASDALRAAGVEPYLWMDADLKKLLKELGRDRGSLGVLGIACVPELARGMRACYARGVPVVGVPLNGNRCARWMGALHETSFHLEALTTLLAEARP